MKILLINVVYKTGSTGNIVANLFNEFNSKGNETFLIYGRGKHKKENNIYRETFELESKIHHFFSLFTGNMYGGMFFSTRRIISRIKKIKPDVVNLHCLNGYFVNIYSLLKWLSKNKIKTVLTMHADFMMTGGCGIAGECNRYLNFRCKNCPNYKEFNSHFSFIKKRYYWNYKKINYVVTLFGDDLLRITTVSPWLEKRYKESSIYSGKLIKSIFNPVDHVFGLDNVVNPYLNSFNFLYITSDLGDKNKSGHFLEKIALKRKDIHFTVICPRNIEHKFFSSNITYIKGGLSQEDLRNYYYFADGSLVLSKRETFSMIAAESLSCGTPVYGFKCGGPESISIPEFSSFFDYGDVESIAKSLKKNEFAKKVIIEKAQKTYSLKTISEEYLETFKFN